MSFTITGRILGLTESKSNKLEVNVGDNESSQPLAKPIHTDRDGRFELTLDKPPSGRVTLKVTDQLGQITEVDLENVSDTGEVIVVLPEISEDPRDHVEHVAKTIVAEREAVASAKKVLAKEIKTRIVDEEAIDEVVNDVLTQLADHSGGDLQWKVRGKETIQTLTKKAVSEARTVLDDRSPVVVARQNALVDGEQMSTRELITRLTGGRTHRDGFWRVDPLESFREREVNVDADGLPKPIESEALNLNSPSDNGRTLRSITDETIKNSVRKKVNDLVEATRLPEDPPLLVADSPMTGTGADVEFVRGVSDVTAFHDVHELVLAMPNVWQDVFDQRFVALLYTAVAQLATAGVDIQQFSASVPSGENPAARILQRFQTLQHVFETSSAAKIQPHLTSMVTPTATAIADGVTDPAGKVLYKDNKPAPGDGFGPSITGVPGIDMVNGDMVLEPPPRVTRPSLLRELEGYLKGEHAFTIFAADGAERAINFGLLLTWRQLWQPLNYQAGEIVHTMTLAPGAEQTVITKKRRSLKRYTAEAEKAQSSRSLTTTDTARAESEILRKANASTNFQLTSEGSTKLLVSDGSFTTSATRDVGREGNDTRRRFRESVMKAAQEYREEHSMEVKTEEEELFEEETTTKFRNPNDEIVMNAVFYSLQRRYQIQEHLYRARPVIMVAMPVPDPSEITSAWIIRYAWIIRRVLLDDRFTFALDYLSTSFLGDQVVLADLQRSVHEHTKALKEARYRLAEARALVESRGQFLRDARESASKPGDKDLFERLEDSGVPIVETAGQLVSSAVGFVDGLFGGGGDEDAERRERAALMVEAAEDELLRAERQSREAEIQVTAASSTLQQATRDYVKAKRAARNHEVRIAQLRIHLSDNILHYMQSIWASVPPDQLFFELHNVRVPILDDNVQVAQQGTFDQPGLGGFTQDQFSTEFVSNGGPLTFRSLAELARLEPIGFKGNLVMFEMYDGNALTDRILAPYLDENEILRDPNDIAASWTLTELREYADMIRARVVAGEISQADFDTIHAPFLRATLERLLTDPGSSEDVVIAPANSVFAELLVTGDSLLEPFKLEHRALDVAIVRSELRENELDNARRAVRIGTDDFEDPDIEAKYVFEGDGTATVVSPAGPGGAGPDDPGP